MIVPRESWQDQNHSYLRFTLSLISPGEFRIISFCIAPKRTVRKYKGVIVFLRQNPNLRVSFESRAVTLWLKPAGLLVIINAGGV